MRTGEITRCSVNETKDWKTFAWRMELCYIVVGAIVLQGGWPLFYIEWRWCLWTIIILISKTLWLLVCSFLHYWHSYLRLSDNVLRHRKPPRNFGERKGGVSIFHILRGQPTLWAVVLFYDSTITYLTAGFKQIKKDTNYFSNLFCNLSTTSFV